jgi:hypothetical protein
MRMFPAVYLWLFYALSALLFPDRLQYLSGMVHATFLWLGCHAIGKQLLKRFHSSRDLNYAFAVGLGSTLFASYLVFLFSTSSISTATIWLIVAIFGFTELSKFKLKLPLWTLWAAPFFVIAIWSTFTPTVFFDALVYHLGLPYQYLSAGKMSVLHNHLYSTFPPFDQTLNLLFVSTGADGGIKVFSLMVFCELAALLVRFKSARTSSQVTVLSLVFLSSIWILIHVVTADLLVALFFCSGFALLTSDKWPHRRILLVALLFAFAAWTKINILLYVALTTVYWTLTYKTQRWKQLAVCYSVFFLLIVPLLLRNSITVGDPLYPMFANVLHSADWSPAQTAALRIDSFPQKVFGMKSMILVPWDLTFHPGRFGSAAEVGILPLFGLVLYIFIPKNSLSNRVLAYFFACFLFWLIIFPNFRQFFPVFPLLYRPIGDALQWLKDRIKKLFPIVWISAFICSCYFLLPIYRSYFPLIHLDQTQDQYLDRMLDYYSAVKSIDGTAGKVLLIGETRTAYIHSPVIACTAYDQQPLLLWLAQTKSAEELLEQMTRKDVRYILYNRQEMTRLVQKYRIWRATPQQELLLQTFLRTYAIPKGRSGPVYVFEIRTSNAR